MILDFKHLIEKYQMNIKGIIHVGASYGQEIPIYVDIGIKNVVFFEPLKDVFQELEKNAKPHGFICFNVALGEKKESSKIFREHKNGGQSSSILEPGLHKEYYPHIVFDSMELIQIETLDSYNFNGCYNMINLDVQGYEKKVLLGAQNTLKKIDFIYTELNFEYLYKDCVLAHELDDFLSVHGFKRIETGKITNGWTDGLYSKL